MRISIHKKRIHRKILILIVIIGVLIFLFANKNFQTLLVLKKEIVQLKQRIAGLKEENRELEEELEAMKNDPEYFESLARRELGLIKPGETKYKFVESEEEK
ncbi:septum formation initiator family protein [bacterium]|jgi:cell division protein FtsB|nr:septum formation initiator family protein [bacterium]